jgi:hypothetical protein
MFCNIKEFEIDIPNILSDHCLVSCTFSLDRSRIVVHNSDTSDQDEKYVDFRYVWNNDYKSQFVEGLSSVDMSSCFDSLSNYVLQNKILMIVYKIFKILLIKLHRHYLKKTVMKGCENIPSYVNNSPWYDHECVEKKNVPCD